MGSIELKRITDILKDLGYEAVYVGGRMFSYSKSDDHDWEKVHLGILTVSTTGVVREYVKIKEFQLTGEWK
jgi:hypothetical protein